MQTSAERSADCCMLWNDIFYWWVDWACQTFGFIRPISTYTHTNFWLWPCTAQSSCRLPEAVSWKWTVIIYSRRRRHWWWSVEQSVMQWHISYIDHDTTSTGRRSVGDCQRRSARRQTDGDVSLESHRPLRRLPLPSHCSTYLLTKRFVSCFMSSFILVLPTTSCTIFIMNK